MSDYAPDAGDVVWTDFNSSVGREQGGRRPALVVSPHEFFDGARFVVVCPITSRVRPFGSSVVLPSGSAIAGEILVAQMRVIDALARPLRFSGTRVNSAVLSAVRRKLAFLCGISPSDLSAP